MTELEYSALICAWLDEGTCRDEGRPARPADQPRCPGDQPTAVMSVGGPRWYCPVGDRCRKIQSFVSSKTTASELGSMAETLCGAGEVAENCWHRVHSMHGSCCAPGLPAPSCSLLLWQMATSALAASALSVWKCPGTRPLRTSCSASA